MSARRKPVRKRKSLNVDSDAAFNGETPRTLLLNVLREPEVQQTVKKRNRRSYLNVKKQSTSSVKPSNLLETSITPRTAIQNVMAAGDVMHTVARPARPRRSPRKKPKEKVYPVVTQQDLHKQLQEKLAGLKKATIRFELPEAGDEVSSEHEGPQEEEAVKKIDVSSDASEPPVQDSPPRLDDHQLVEDASPGNGTPQHGDVTNEDSVVSPQRDNQDDTISEDTDLDQRSSPGSQPEDSPAVKPDEHSIHPPPPNQPANSSPVISLLQNDNIPPSDSELANPSDPLRLSTMHEDEGNATTEGRRHESEEEFAEEERPPEDNEAPEHYVPHFPVPSTAKRTAPSLRRLTSRSARKRPAKASPPSIIPRSQLKGILQHYSPLRVDKEAVDVAEDMFASFFKRLCVDMEAVAQFGGRAIVNKEDLELIMKRQRFVTRERSLNMLIREYLPLEYQQLLIEEAQSVVVPRKKKTK